MKLLSTTKSHCPCAWIGQRLQCWVLSANHGLTQREFFNMRPIFRSPFMRGGCSALDSGIPRMLRDLSLWVLTHRKGSNGVPWYPQIFITCFILHEIVHAAPPCSSATPYTIPCILFPLHYHYCYKEIFQTNNKSRLNYIVNDLLSTTCPSIHQ